MKTILLLLSLWILTTCFGQEPKDTSEFPAVREVIYKLFNAMKNGDSSSLRSCFEPGAHLATSMYSTKANAPIVVKETLSDFLNAVGTPHKEKWNERVLSMEIRQDDGLATAWVPYAFYIDDTYSHEGVNAFQLVKTTNGWRILAITDTRRRSNQTH